MNLFWIPASALARLALRRALGPVFLVGCAVLLVLLALRDWAPPTTGLGAASAEEARRIANGLARQGIWSGVLILIVPILILRAARTVSAWREGDVEWLACRATPRSTILVWTWLGSCAAGLAVLAATGFVAEMRAGPSLPGAQLAGRLGPPGSAWVEGRRALAWSVGDPRGRAPRGSRLRFELALASGTGPGAEVILRARRAPPENGPGLETRAAQRIGTRAAIEVELPPGAGAVDLWLECAQAEDRVLLMSRAGELLVPAASDRAAGWEILARASLALAAGLALALGLGAWMNASSATAAILALMLVAWMAPRPSAIWPGADLLDALAIAGHGRVPPEIDARSIAVAALVVAGGLGLARWSLARWRRES
jgi:hypothetical protein